MMEAIFHDALASLAQIENADKSEAPFYQPSETLIAAIKEASQLRHARYCGLATTMGEILVRGITLSRSGARRALFTVGRDLHTPIARRFGERLIEAGPRRLNPIMFPHTLPSAAAVTLGAIAEAHLCAIGFDGASAFNDALTSANLLLTSETADEVLLIFFGSPGKKECMLCATGLLLSASRGAGGVRLRFELTGQTEESRTHASTNLQRIAAIAAGRVKEARIDAFLVSLAS